MSKPKPSLRAVPGVGDVVDDVAAAASSALDTASSVEAPAESEQPAATEPESSFDAETWKRLGMELVIAASGGAGAGAVVSSAGRRPRGAAVGAGVSAGVWGLSRGLFDRDLSTMQRTVLAIFGAASFGGSMYAAFRKGA